MPTTRRGVAQRFRRAGGRRTRSPDLTTRSCFPLIIPKTTWSWRGAGLTVQVLSSALLSARGIQGLRLWIQKRIERCVVVVGSRKRWISRCLRFGSKETVHLGIHGSNMCAFKYSNCFTAICVFFGNDAPSLSPRSLVSELSRHVPSTAAVVVLRIARTPDVLLAD